MVYLYDACDQISDFCHQQLLRKMRRKIKSDIWSQASYRYLISWEAFLDSSDSYFLFADLVGFYTHWTYMHIFRHIFLSNYWWQRSDIWSQASYRYPISWEAFLDSSDSYFLFADFVDFYTHLTWMRSIIPTTHNSDSPLLRQPIALNGDVQPRIKAPFPFQNILSRPWSVKISLTDGTS
jgi:hypothetical protein